MIRETKTPSIPDIRDDNVLDVLRAIKATVDVREGHIGDPLDQAATLRDLTDLNLVSKNGQTNTASGGSLPVGTILPSPIDPSGYNPATDLTTPPAPKNLSARGSVTNVYLDWDGAPYRNHAYTEIWRNTVDSLTTAIRVGTTVSNVYADPAEPETTYYYWIRFVSQANITGPWNSTSGTMAKTSFNVATVINALAKEIVNSQLYNVLGQRISQIEVDAYVANRSKDSVLATLTTRVGASESKITDLRTTTETQAIVISALRTKSGTTNKIFFQGTAPTNPINGYTLQEGDLWYDTANNYKSYRWNDTTKLWVEYVSAAKVYYGGSFPVGVTLFPGDLFFMTPDNHPYRWSGTSWVDIRDAWIDASITNFETTRIGYATLNGTGSYGNAGDIFDNNGAITNQAGVTAWNSGHPSDTLTWHSGLPIAYAVKNVSVWDGAQFATVSQRFVAQRTTDNGLWAQYTVKIDMNGHVSGFGLASTSSGSTPTSAFIVRADKFAVVAATDAAIPLGTTDLTSYQDRVPFMVFTGTTPVTIAGKTKTYPAGVWMNAAFIANATIDSALISDLTAEKITTGTLTANISVTTAKIHGGTTVPSGTGFFLGDDGGTHKFYVGNGTQYMLWNGSALAVVGTIHATDGSIGGLNMNGSQIYTTGVSNYYTGTGIYFDNTGYFRAGNPGGNGLVWDRTNLTINGGGTFTGALSAATGTFAGSLTAATGSFSGTVNASGGTIGGMTLTGSQMYSNTVSSYVSGQGFYVDNTGYFRVGNPAGQWIEWNRTSLNVYGDIIATGNIKANNISVTLAASSSDCYYSPPQVTVDDGATTGSSTILNGEITLQAGVSTPQTFYLETGGGWSTTLDSLTIYPTPDGYGSYLQTRGSFLARVAMGGNAAYRIRMAAGSGTNKAILIATALKK